MKTNKHFRLSFVALFFLCTVVLLSACSKKDVRSDEAFGEEDGAGTVSESGEVGTEGLGGVNASGLSTVYFDYDSYSLRSDAREALKANAEWLKQNSGSQIQIEGHCDSRGTLEYNDALGERRAKAVRNYLSQMGVSGSRLSTISYGERNPVALGETESDYAQNRRAEFKVLK